MKYLDLSDDCREKRAKPPPNPLLSKKGEDSETVRGGSYSDNLILYRTNAQSRKIEEALMIA
ncbi:MAG: hypothetical protein KAH48_11720, partial [Chlorobi bacterium]|nr:hypothetical protein [Chlorobiota bacterium]